jgi:uncharacterized RmlC-like cupin family protein
LAEQVRLFRAVQRGPQTATTQTAGIQREQLVSTDNCWVGIAYTEPESVSGWHHHGDYDSYIYAISGRLRLEWGPGGRESVEADPGDVFNIPKGVVHRELTLGAEKGAAFLVRVGTGEPVINVDGPEGG